MLTIYKDAFQTSGINTHSKTIHELIKSDKLKSTIHQLRTTADLNAKKQLKSQLPCATFYGTFRNDKRAESIQTANGLMIFDYDDLKTAEEASRVKALFRQHYNQYTHLMFVSPSFGVKVAFKTDLLTKDNDYHVYAYNKLRRDIENKLNIKLDKSTCNINRLTYLAHDADAFYNSNSDVYHFDLESQYRALQKRQERELRRQSLYLNSQEIDHDKKAKFGRKAIKRYLENNNTHGSRHNGIYTLGMQLYSYGYTQLEVSREFDALKRIKAFTDPDTKKRATDIHQSFSRSGKLSTYVLKHNKHSLKSFVSAFSQ